MMQSDNVQQESRSEIDLQEEAAISDVIDSLTRPEAYQHRPASVTWLQTHISLLFFAGELVYKVKKPVDMGFLDYSTLAARRHYCHEEVRLNRRLAPKIYRGVRSIEHDEAGRLYIGDFDRSELNPNPLAIDFAVEMKRLPADRMLSSLLSRDRVRMSDIQAVADTLADFHSHCPTGPGVNEHASPDSLRVQVDENLAQLRPFVERLISPTLHATVQQWLTHFLEEQAALLHNRIAAGRIRDGHGDVHCENICLVDDEVVIYDCIEFTPRFRCRDVACELAFLAMDLDARGHRALGEQLVHRYVQVTTDEQIKALLRFYKVHLAIVRCKVAALKSSDVNVEPEQQQEAADTAMRYGVLAGAYITEPALIITCGLPGSGKSFAARAVAQTNQSLVLRSDVIRKQLAGIEPTQRASTVAPHVYQPPFTRRVYETMLEQAEAALRQHRTVVVDATFATESLRRPFVDLARQFDVPFALLHCEAPQQEIQQRMQRRAHDTSEVSDADYEVYQQARARWQDPLEVDSSQRTRIGPNTEPLRIATLVADVLLKQQRRTMP